MLKKSFQQYSFVTINDTLSYTLYRMINKLMIVIDYYFKSKNKVSLLEFFVI